MSRRCLLVCLCVGFLLPSMICMAQLQLDMRLDMQTALARAAATACNPPAGCAVSDFQRQEVAKGIVHYSAILQVGPGPYDRIGIHRVVRENQPGYPIKQVDRIMLQHGDAKDFVGMFLTGLYSPTTPDDFGFATYLAQNNVDVWGIDQGWVLVPPDTTEFGFMQNWGLQHAVEDLRRALAVARETRKLMGESGDRFNLLGYSSGGMTGYALLNLEAGLPNKERHVQGYISADMPYISTNPTLRDVFCADRAIQQDQYNQGAYGSFVPFQLLGNLGRSDPDGPSPILAGLTNLQAALFFGTAPLFGATPVHYLAGEFGADGLPTGLQYVRTGDFLDFLESAIVWQPTLFFLDYDEVLCGINTPFDDNLRKITVPVYNWGAAGRSGPMARRCATTSARRTFPSTS